MMIMEGIGDLVQKTGDDHTSRVLGAQTIERLGDTVCDLHHAREDEKHEFLS
jgi:hypothetical protein